MHRYWKRAWILQECILAKRLDIQCGSQRFSDTRLWNLVYEYKWRPPDQQHSMGLFMNVAIFAGFDVLEAQTRWHDASARTYYCPWSSDSMRRQCPDPRDSIYSSITIMDPAVGIIPDYSKTTEQLFVKIAGHYIEWEEGRGDCFMNLMLDLDLIGILHSGRDHWEVLPPAVRQRCVEGYGFSRCLEKRQRLTKSEFRAEWQHFTKGRLITEREFYAWLHHHHHHHQSESDHCRCPLCKYHISRTPEHQV